MCCGIGSNCSANCGSIIAYNVLSESIKFCQLGGSPGLVVMGGDSRSKGHGFQSRRCILDGHDIFHIALL